MKKSWVCIAIALCWVLMLAFPVAAGEIPKNAEAEYAERYAEQIASFSRGGIGQKEFNTYLKRLRELGFYPSTRVERDNTHLTHYIQASISVFCQCAGIAPQTKFTEMVRALLQDESFAVRPFFPLLLLNGYYEKNGGTSENRIPYTDKQLRSLRNGNKCAVEGTVVSITEASGNRVAIVLATDGGMEFSTEYQYPERSTHFVENDAIVVYGAVEDRDATPCSLSADFIGLK